MIKRLISFAKPSPANPVPKPVVCPERDVAQSRLYVEGMQGEEGGRRVDTELEDRLRTF